MEITLDQFREWRDAIYTAECTGHNCGLKAFKEKYPVLYKHMTAMVRKRYKLRKVIHAYERITPFIYWGCLTWCEEKNLQEVKTKRKQALRFLEKFFKLYAFVEEYGHENNRYHVHFFGVIKNYTAYEDMRSKWHSFCQIELLKSYEYKRKIKYLTDYVLKDVPRVRMNSRTALLLKQVREAERMSNLGFTFHEGDYYKNVADVVDLPF